MNEEQRKATALRRIMARDKAYSTEQEDKALRRLLVNIEISRLNKRYKNVKNKYPYI